MNLIGLNNYILSSVSHIREHTTLKPVIEFPPERKHVSLLDGIDLGLTTKAKGDVTAVMMKQSATTIDFLYSKNKLYNGYLDGYLQAISPRAQRLY